MKKIQKELALATAYKKWLDDLNNKKANHPIYSSQKTYYRDIVANLLWVQNGLCAYTEMYLKDPKDFKPENWNKGRYKNQSFEFLGQLEHYNNNLKETTGWEWNNFFVVHSDVNTKRKGTKTPKGKLKPDQIDYDPFHFLEYDFKTHNFLPNSERDFDEQEDIMHDIFVLGLNYQPIIDYRRDFLNPIIDDIELGTISLANARLKMSKFQTAFEMSIRSLNLVE